MWSINKSGMKLGVNCMPDRKSICSIKFWIHVLPNWVHLWFSFEFSFHKIWVSGMHPWSPNHFPPLAACCLLNVYITPFSPMLPFCLLWWRYCTLLSCMLSRPQCNLVCVIFSHECMHTCMALACWDYSFSVLEGGNPVDESRVRMCPTRLLYMFYIFSPNFEEVKIFWLFKGKKKINVVL